MAFTRVKPAGWAVNEKLTSAQMNALDIDHAAAVDVAQMTLAQSLAAALNWTIKGGTTNNLKRAAWSAKDQAWFAVGNGGNDFLEVTFDEGRNWTNLTASLGGAAKVDVDVAVSSGGSVVVMTNTTAIHTGARTAYATYTWSPSSGTLVAAPAGGGCDYDATAAKFVAVYQTGAVGHADFSTAGTGAWTGGTVPAAWSTYVGTQAPEVTCIPGRAIAAYIDASVPRLNIMRSTDGGATWNNVQVTLAMTAADASANSLLGKPAWNSVRDEWYITVSTTTGTRRTEFYRSTDGGLNWSLVTTISADFVANDVACVGDLIVMTNDDARVAYSQDRGATWKLAGRLVGSAARRYLRSGGNGFLSLNSADKTSFASFRSGDGGNAL